MRTFAKIFWLAFLAFGLTAYAAQGGPHEESALKNTASLLELLDAVESGHEVNVSQGKLSEQLEQTQEALASFIQANPDNADALIMSARLDRFSLMMEPIMFSPEEGLPSQISDYASIHEKLDRALEIQPNSAEAHYWKARMYGMTQPVIRDDTFYMEEVDLGQAIEFARKSVELEPGNVAYREALAVYLISAEQSEQALEVMRTVAGGRHPIYLLLNEMKDLPIPATAVLSGVDSRNLAQMAAEAGMVPDYPYFRVHAYMVPMPLAELQKFYAGHWKGFRFFSEDGSAQQLLTRKKGVLSPASSASKIPAEPSAGIWMMVMEAPCEEIAEELESQGVVAGRWQAPATRGDECCRMIVFNLNQLN